MERNRRAEENKNSKFKKKCNPHFCHSLFTFEFTRKKTPGSARLKDHVFKAKNIWFFESAVNYVIIFKNLQEKLTKKERNVQRISCKQLKKIFR